MDTCRKGHDKAVWWRTYPSMPYGRCLACSAEQQRDWKARNQQHLRDYMRLWREKARRGR